MADAKKILILSGLGLGVLAILAIASPGKSTVYVNPPPTPPDPRLPSGPGPGTPPPSVNDAIAAAIAAAQGAYANFPGAPIPPTAQPNGQGQMPQQIPSGLLLPNPAVLVQGQRYKSRLELGVFQASLATKDAIRNQFEALGFSNVIVYASPNELPPGWPQQALANATARSRWVEGTWNQTTQSVAKPPEIQNAWTA